MIHLTDNGDESFRIVNGLVLPGPGLLLVGLPQTKFFVESGKRQIGPNHRRENASLAKKSF